MILTLCFKPFYFDLRSKGRVKGMNRTAVFHVSTNSQKKLFKNKQTLAFALVLCPQDVTLKMKAIPILLFLFL